MYALPVEIVDATSEEAEITIVRADGSVITARVPRSALRVVEHEKIVGQLHELSSATGLIGEELYEAAARILYNEVNRLIEVACVLNESKQAALAIVRQSVGRDNSEAVLGYLMQLSIVTCEDGTEEE